ncbi:hypothetical protein AWN88_04260 [Agrobacterium tumefaciens]|nr:hypothetical protein AWN88_04260 [Agrobacterium tumefaciens]
MVVCEVESRAGRQHRLKLQYLKKRPPQKHLGGGQLGRSSTVTKPGAVSERLATQPIGRAALEPGTAAIVP